MTDDDDYESPLRERHIHTAAARFAVGTGYYPTGLGFATGEARLREALHQIRVQCGIGRRGRQEVTAAIEAARAGEISEGEALERIEVLNRLDMQNIEEAEAVIDGCLTPPPLASVSAS